MNEEKFTGKADNYDKYRPSYPAELISWLYTKTRAETVADIAAGTGKFTECLLSRPWDVTAVEPNGDMIAHLRRNLRDVKIIQASAENMGIPDNSTDLVTAASAFHWFDEELFRQECKRILTENGRVAVIFMHTDESPLMNERKEAARIYYGKSRGGKRPRSEVNAFLMNEYFAEAEYAEFRYVQTLDEEGFVGNTLSRSHALKEGDVGFEGFVYELRQMFRKYESFGTVDIPYTVSCFLGKF